MRELTEIQKKIAKNILDCIAVSNYTQAEVSKKIGMAAPTLSQMLHGTAAIPLNQFMRIADVLDLPQEMIDEIFSLYLESLDIRKERFSLMINRNYYTTISSDAESLIESMKEKLNHVPEDRLRILDSVIDVFMGKV